MKKQLLEQILAEVKRPGRIRAALIGFLFPEIDAILSHLSSLAAIVEREERCDVQVQKGAA